MDQDQRPLRLLSLDGGGIRGLSSLFILKGIMAQVQSKHTHTERPLLPCDYFDLIAGTSTGGLIAVMLGVLRMDVDACIKEYLDMAPQIFPVEGLIARNKSIQLFKAFRGQERFDPAPLETAIKKLVRKYTQSKEGENATLKSEALLMRQRQCKVFLCATSEKLNKKFRLRNYETSWDPTDDCTIWQACRATSAAPTFFPPIKFGNPEIEYVDGGLGYNNPVRALMNEVTHIWPTRNVGCIISIGTGVQPSADVGHSLKPLLETLKQMALDTEQVAREFKEEFEVRHSERNVYFRFNVQHGLGQVQLEEWREFDRVTVATRDYMKENWREVDLCASQIYNPVDHVSLNLNVRKRTTAESTVPFSRDSFFVKRDEIFTKIDCILDTPNRHKRAALFGLGGVGKSQIAIEYTYMLQDKDPYTWIFWVYASNRVRFEQAYRDIAVAVDLKGREDPKASILVLVSDWLKDDRNGSWLMVIDNADDSNTFFPPSDLSSEDETKLNTPLVEFIPQKAHGKILVTSRNQAAAQDLVGDYGGLVEVTAMTPAESLNLFMTKFPDGTEIDDATPKLLEALEHIPLAVTQAGAFLRQKMKVMTISDYLSKLRKGQRDQTALLNRNMNDLRRDPSVPNAVISTWEVSINQIRAQNRPAADILSLMVLFDRQSIPRILLQEGDESDEDFALSNATSSLLDFSLITVNSDRKSFSMHRLVQITTLSWLQANQSLRYWESKAIKRIADAFPSSKYETWEACSLLLPHAEKVLTYDVNGTGEETKLQYALILGSTGQYVLSKGNHDLASQRLEESLALRREFLNKKDIRVLRSMGNLALAYSKQGRWKEAEKLHIQSIKATSRVLGKEHPETLTQIKNPAVMYYYQEWWKKAAKLSTKVYKTREKVLGKEHPDTLINMSNLAYTYSNQGCWKEAEKLEVQVLKIRKRVLGKEHPDTLTSINNLACTYSDQGRWKKAEELEVQALEIKKRVLGKEHPDTLTSINNLACTYSDQGRWKEAKELQVQALETEKRVLGKEHPATLTSMSNLACTYSDQGRWKEAEELEVQVLETRKRVLGKEHPATLTSMSNLAHTYCVQQHKREAILLMADTVKHSRETRGAGHPDTLAFAASLAQWKNERI